MKPVGGNHQLTMTNIDALFKAVEELLENENVGRYGKTQLKVEAPKHEVYLFQDRPRIDWHSGIPNHLCAFTDSFDENHCAAYVYVWEEIHRLKCTLRISNIDGAHYADLPYISKSLDDREIAKRVIDLVITGTERLKARGTIEHVIGSECWLSSSELPWYSTGGL